MFTVVDDKVVYGRSKVTVYSNELRATKEDEAFKDDKTIGFIVKGKQLEVGVRTSGLRKSS